MSRTLPPTAAFAGVAAVFAGFFLAAGAPTPLLALRQAEWGFSQGTLALAFSIYAVALLGAVLIGGSLSDHVGRRPVLFAAVGGELASMVVFLWAPTINWVIVARTIQGLATGLATSAFSAAIVEHAPVHLKKLGGTFAGAAVAGGLGLGALAAGAAVQLSADANTIVFAVLAAIMVIGLIVVAVTKETADQRPGALRSLSPSITVPAHVRREFLSGLPVHIAGWMLPAFFLALSPSVLRIQFGLDGGLLAGFTAFLGPFSAAVATVVSTRYAPRRSTQAGIGLVLVGMTVVTLGVLGEWLTLLWIGGTIGGVGFGASFGGQLRLIVPHIAPHQRAGVLSAIYTAGYLAFGIPVVLAGQGITRWGLLPTFEAYAAVVIAFAAIGVAAQAALRRRDAATPQVAVVKPSA